MTSRSVDAAPAPETADPYRPLRLARRGLVLAVAGFCALYYPILNLIVASLVPLVGLLPLGFLTGFVARRKAALATLVVGWLVVAAVLVRRVATAGLAAELLVFDGHLAGYPTWSVWFAEAVRVAVYLWVLWLGARLGRRARLGVERAVRSLGGGGMDPRPPR